ncbi:hypothetical protein ACTXT7_003379 [Hymenolepis weldensis]
MKDNSTFPELLFIRILYDDTSVFRPRNWKKSRSWQFELNYADMETRISNREKYPHQGEFLNADKGS